MMKKIILTMLSFIMFITLNISLGFAEEQAHSFNTIQQLTNTLYEEVKSDNYLKAKEIIQSISKEITNINYEKAITVEGMDAIADTIIETKHSLSAIQPNSDQVVLNTTRLYLAIDAITHQQQPLWLGYYNLLNKDILDKSLDDYKNHYLVIKPAMIVSNKTFFIEKIDSLLVALNNKEIAKEEKELLLTELKETTFEAFHGNEMETWGKVIKESTIYETSLGMGLIIFLVLTYVIWRKFRGSYIAS